MFLNKTSFKKIRKNYLNFIKSQEVLSEPFRDKIGQLNNFYLPISKRISKKYLRSKKTQVIGLTGGQGAGKSTISKIIKIILNKGFNLETVIFSIDDFYKTFSERKKMNERISPLFLTRGVPGTHDTNRLFRCIKNLKSKNFKPIFIPKFDKANDDRMNKKEWLYIKKKPDIVIFEGWCVGAKPQKNKDLIMPLNELEKYEDKTRVWRNKVNKELKKDYKKIFKLIDKIIFLKVPSFKYVFKWRLLQEKKLRNSSRGKKTMSDKQIKRFIMFYERITKHMLRTMRLTSDIIINIGKKHRLKSIKIN